ncbi:OB-fold protein [Spongiimicrobium sp. 3-5]|uniref:OB-fold protein n=1 Tax=Spongiimicrobium sp. 3-5 TaxID=3332596 RepID=UPI0039803479
MKISTRRLLLTFLIALTLGSAIALYYYNKPAIDVQNADTAYALSAKNLIWEYQEDEISTNKKYLEKIIQVKGLVAEVAFHKGFHVVTLNGEGLDSKVICHMEPTENKKTAGLEKGQMVAVKGICTGYLLDVMLIKCVLIN